jgi:hypothetical protein
MTIDPFVSYKLYQALKLHFESDTYDALKYNYKTSASPQSFFKRKDKYFFAKVGRKVNSQQELIEYYVSNFVKDVKWVGEMVNQQGDDNYSEYKKTQESISYIFKNDIYTLGEDFDSLLRVENNQHPMLIKKFLQDSIKLETVVIIDKLTGFMNRADKEITEQLVWPDISRKVKKYKPFVNADMNKCKKIILEVFTN